MLTKRIIPCLDIKDGKTVKGINFENIRDAGDPVALSSAYAHMGADELVFLDITATQEKRALLLGLVKEIAQTISIPFTVGGGISRAQDVEQLLNAGADKISINSAAIYNPKLINELARAFGSQCIVIAIDTSTTGTVSEVFARGGKQKTGLHTLAWASEAADRGAGEILLTSINNDGAKTGFALEITRAVSEAVSIPVIASGGAGNAAHFEEVFRQGKADAALAASIFHFNEVRIPELKNYLFSKQIPVRL